MQSFANSHNRIPSFSANQSNLKVTPKGIQSADKMKKSLKLIPTPTALFTHPRRNPLSLDSLLHSKNSLKT